MANENLVPILRNAIGARLPLLDAEHRCAVRLFNGFSEGCPDLVIDLYGTTAVLHNHADPPAKGEANIQPAWEALTADLPWIDAALVKNRCSRVSQERQGVALSSSPLTDRVREQGAWYALDLLLHQECTLHLDTRNLRSWASNKLRSQTVLNTFAYTGSLGVAALVGGARRVVQLDRSHRFLDHAQKSYRLNGFPVDPDAFVCADFFRATGGMRRRKQVFDCVFLDPPFFSTTPAGTVDMQRESAVLVNKVRPLVKPGGTLAAVNNALFVSGSTYMRELEALGRDGHLEVLELVPVPEDYIGMVAKMSVPAITDPSPFNHSTKIAILRVL